MESIEQQLLTLKTASTQSRPIAVFDCDGTLIRGDIGEAMFYHQIEGFLFRRSPADAWQDYALQTELAAKVLQLTPLPAEERAQAPEFERVAHLLLSRYFDQLKEMKTAKACSDIVSLWSGWTPEETRSIAKDVLRKELASQLTTVPLGGVNLSRGIRFIRETLSLLRLVQEFEYDVWVISGSNQWSVEAVTDRLEIEDDRVIGIDLTTNAGTLTSDVRSPVPVLEGKVDALLQRAGRMPDLVVSDSVYDIPLFASCTGVKVLVNSRNHSNADFFNSGGLHHDGTWHIIDQLTFDTTPESAWQTQR